ncbi:hypothetical protein FA04_29200 (plasmid) [Ensifer adhaerens]|nr:hypothetical protein FA04_29200 [Ensifer adhaerens]KDP73204.1 hypothetical protein FA04_13370 [Ensifer adhaerens]KQX20414.1 hypothetical protein ASD01_30930 [Ensifer sp. Root423]
MPWIDNHNTGAFEIPDIASHDCHVVNQSSRGNQGVCFVAPVGNMQVRATSRNRIIDRQNATCELGSNLAVEPRAQPRALCGIPALHAKHSSLQFKDCDGRDEEASRIFCPNPLYDIGISFAVADLA